MANRWCDGFGRYGGTTAYMLNGSSGQAWAQVDSGWELSTANPRTGTHHLRLDGGGGHEARRVFGAPQASAYFGHAVNFSALPDSEHFIGGVGSNISIFGVFLAAFRDQANNNQVSFWLGTDGSIICYRDGTLQGSGAFTGELLGRSVPIIGAGAYQHIEYFADIGNSGAVEVRVDEVTRLNLTDVDTLATANEETSQVAFGTTGSALPSGATWDVADCYANDTEDDGSGCDTFIGDCKSGVLIVNADTAQADFDLSAGVSGYDLLDDRPPNDATYISTEAETAESDFGFANGPANLTEILTARPFVRAWKDDAGTCEIAPSLISNGDKAVVDPQPIATAPSYYDSNVPLNPDTTAPWTLSELDAALEVVERTS